MRFRHLNKTFWLLISYVVVGTHRHRIISWIFFFLRVGTTSKLYYISSVEFFFSEMEARQKMHLLFKTHTHLVIVGTLHRVFFGQASVLINSQSVTVGALEGTRRTYVFIYNKLSWYSWKALTHFFVTIYIMSLLQEPGVRRRKIVFYNSNSGSRNNIH